MAKRSAPAEVRSTGPEPAADVDEARMLYREVQQIPDPKQFKVQFLMLSPRTMNEMLRKADADEQFRQRPTTVADIDRWKKLVESNRFVHYLPNGPLCYDPDGALLNGKHRLTAGVACDKSLGFMIVRNVPRWMFRFFDTPKQQKLRDVLVREGRGNRTPQDESTLRLALRYEELLHGLRGGFGWKHWSGTRDEHTDLEDLFYRRGDLLDLHASASKAHRGLGGPGSRLIITSLMVFRYYQQLAWPQGQEKLEAFWDGLTTGADLSLGSPPKTLREWGYDSYMQRETWSAKRESHLLLLLNMFAAYVRGEKASRITWAYGLEMPVPYHPDGPDAAVKNVLSALEEYDQAAQILF